MQTTLAVHHGTAQLWSDKCGDFFGANIPRHALLDNLTVLGLNNRLLPQWRTGASARSPLNARLLRLCDRNNDAA